MPCAAKRVVGLLVAGDLMSASENGPTLHERPGWVDSGGSRRGRLAAAVGDFCQSASGQGTRIPDFRSRQGLAVEVGRLSAVNKGKRTFKSTEASSQSDPQQAWAVALSRRLDTRRSGRSFGIAS
jgi:hypothetical protein